MIKMLTVGTVIGMYLGIVRFADSVKENTGGFFSSPSGVVTLAVLTVLSSGFAAYILKTVPKQFVIQLQVRDAILGNKERKEPGLLDNVASLERAFHEHLESREREMQGIHSDIAGIHEDLAVIKQIVMPSRRRYWR